MPRRSSFFGRHRFGQIHLVAGGAELAFATAGRANQSDDHRATAGICDSRRGADAAVMRSGRSARRFRGVVARNQQSDAAGPGRDDGRRTARFAVRGRSHSGGADLGVAPRRLGDASLFTGLINQALAPTLCSACKRPCAEHIHEIEDDLRARIEAFTNVKKVYLRGTRPDCPACGGMGVTGRTVVAEIVLTAQPLMDIYRAEAGGSAAAKSYWVKQMKGITKCRHLIEKSNQGWIDPKMGEEAVCSLAEDTFTLQ